MKNPYHDIFEPEEIHVPRGFGIAAIVGFLLICVVPSTVRNIRDAINPEKVAPVTQAVQLVSGKGDFDAKTITGKLRDLEGRIEDAPFTELPRRYLQQFLTTRLGHGNTKTYVGENGWLYLQPALAAMTSTGPVAPPALSVASDPSLKSWRRALPAILKFAEDLGKRDIELLFVPIPVKPMVYPEGVGGEELSRAPLRHHDQIAFYDILRKAGINVIDLTEPLWEMKGKGGDTYLKQDTHWRPEAMERAAEILAEEIKSRSWFDRLPIDPDRFEFEEIEREHIGDLVEKLDLPDGNSLFKPETAIMHRVIDKETGEIVEDDAASPVVLLGDSFTNIFNDPSLGFSTDEEREAPELIGAGLAQHLAAKLGMGIDVFAQNGSASSNVRKDFAKSRYDDQVRRKTIVVWTIAARDILYTPKLAKENNIQWEDVTWKQGKAPEEVIVPGGNGKGILIEATLAADGKGVIRDPNSVPYKDAVFETLWENVVAVDGEELSLHKGGFILKAWAFRDKKMTPESKVQEGKRYRFRIQPTDAVKILKMAQGEPFDTFEQYPSYFAEKIEEVK